MKFVFASYVYSPGFTDPHAWIKHIGFYLGTLEALAVTDTVISIEQIDYEGEAVNNGVKYYFKRYSNHERRFPSKLHRFIRSLSPDVVVIQGLHFPLQIIQLRLMLSPHVKIIVQNHAEQPFTGIKKQLQRIADRGVHAYMFASKPMGLRWVQKGNLASAKKLHEVMEVSSDFKVINKEIAQSKTAVAGQPVFLWVGRLNANKDPLTAVRAFLQYASVQPLAKLYMIYQTDELLEDILIELAKHPSQKNNIKLIGQVPHADLLYWYNSADYIISCSFYEGSGTALCEAMSCGCIPIVTAIDSFKMITDNGKCGMLFEPGDAGGVLTALIQTQQIDTSAKREYTLAHYKATLSFNAIASRFREIATTLLSV
ncbi:glycosyltransferase family 4 protein [Mucilaginibacter boryungensis]|uniref:Glycosyltransferase n=1 Tax=Mucilaginibacter boryungensis TaxID=768480 RepID=A0ABR9XG43_9SPHI|nr:glycosyltransferase [Mucilaginibacter boryungensis]MBE9666347.1 glycosyltransferase [Mucilaginibacter boryungensis]